MPTSATSLLAPPPYLLDTEQWKHRASTYMLQAHQGHLGNTAAVTLLSGTVATAVTDWRAGFNSFIGFMPRTANAAAELGNGTLYVSSQSKGGFTITHANAGTGDRNYIYALLG